MDDKPKFKGRQHFLGYDYRLWIKGKPSVVGGAPCFRLEAGPAAVRGWRQALRGLRSEVGGRAFGLWRLEVRGLRQKESDVRPE